MPGKRRRDEYRGNGKEPMETSAASHDTRKHVLEAAERRQADSAFARLLGDTTKADVTISVDGEHFPAHRCVLAARSPFFRGILEAEGVHRGRQLLSADVSAGAFRVLLRHLYTRALPDAEDCGEGLAIGEMVRVAHDLGTTELYEHCLGIFRASLRPDNVIRRLILADEMGPDALRETVLQYFALGGSRVQREAIASLDELRRAPHLAPSSFATEHRTCCNAGEKEGENTAIELLKAFSFTQDAEPSSAAAPRAASGV